MKNKIKDKTHCRVAVFWAVFICGAIFSKAYATAVGIPSDSPAATQSSSGIIRYIGTPAATINTSNPAASAYSAGSAGSINSASPVKPVNPLPVSNTYKTPVIPIRNHFIYLYNPYSSYYRDQQLAEQAAREEAAKKEAENKNKNTASIEEADDLYKISVDLSSFNNDENKVQITAKTHSVKISGGNFNQTFSISKKVVKDAIRKEKSGNNLIIYVPVK